MIATPECEYDYSLHYRTWHDDSAACAAQRVDTFRQVYGRWLPAAAGAALDIGCGMGFALAGLQSLGYSDVYGIDLDAQQVATCQRRALPVERVEDAAAFLRQHPERYDLILMLDVLEHVPVASQLALLRCVHAALRPGGRLIVTVPNATSPLAARWRYIDWTHHCSFTEHSLRFVLRNAGFAAVTIPGEGPLRRPSLRLWRSAARQALRRWLIRFLWRQVIQAELGEMENVAAIPFDLNLLAVADKAAAAGGTTPCR